MVECQCVLKYWGHQLYKDIGQKRSWDLVLDTMGLFVQKKQFSGIFKI